MISWDAVYKGAWVVLIALLIAGSVLMFIPKLQEYRRYQQTAAKLEEESRHEEEIIKHLKMQQERFRTDPRFVEFVAHEMGMVKSNETIFTFIDDLPATGQTR
ncbi:MAG TPA: septum formation initiator family protein [Kiritimatiellia bacterium]|nr:septum formation initiator family protein [Kiritimatiellia bacterium]HNR94031.1 septum formation initiator family protein [Kiritimatiellia bacterium]HNS79877.1 septum formation initiator family protein [Kiritimatiellia bacterium]HPA78453.1 septum formation initiator family protein [Kiritimatiellia bacterium]HQQ03553.1 septum formation initiator family protein [Kiritimatiellia bacterium]